jgi:hypothetical protein
MSNDEETRICDNCKFSQFGDKYKKGAFEGMCKNHNIPSGGPYPAFPRIRRDSTCGFWQAKQEN